MKMDAGKILKGIKAGVGFLTTIPVRHDDAGFEAFFNNVHLFIVVGAIAGVLLGTTGYILQYFLPLTLVPVLVVFAVLLLTGINHLDGLSDMGDGIIASGTKEKKIAAMKDVHAGAGGILFIGMDLLFLYAAVSLFAGFYGFYLLIGLFVAEICAKVSMLTVAAFGKSLHEGMGSMLIERTRKEHYMVGIAIAIIACAVAASLPVLPFNVFRVMQFALAGFLTVAVSIVVGLFISDVAHKNFGGVNGDVMGAANEIGRIAALVVLGTLIWMLL
jgi:adenosylcobinamide-GDP ribazoletransferase